ncbi:acyl transferase/acyl hydrolase/lysophospholipase [Coprinopsis sp. MPI-PUGE-AT-0042]|nr:acyl transferase/acyl hydrolase/lysophospholipase [Coprinopsis sp. MPI-PUGE-AT-0042]
MPSSFTDSVWLESDAPCVPVRAIDDQVASRIWFKSQPVDRDFCFRVTQLQLSTDSSDQGDVGDMQAGSWTWFELVILRGDSTSDEPKYKDGKELAWRSHSNRLADPTFTTQRDGDSPSITRHFGAIFNCRSELLANLEASWGRFGRSARVLDEDLYTPHRWTLSANNVPSLSDTVHDGSYSIMASNSCFVKSDTNDLTYKLWFATAMFDEWAIKQLEAVQLFTYSRCQESRTEAIAEGESFSWFDLVILETPFETAPKVTNGVSLVWKSHSNSSAHIHRFGTQGQVFDIDISDEAVPYSQQIAQIKACLEPGNAIGVRVCAQYPGWENYAQSGQLVVRISNENREAPPLAIPDMTVADDELKEAQRAMEKLYKEIGYSSTTTATLSNETRADLVFPPPPPYKDPRADSAPSAPPPPYKGSRPLRLLSLDGGGVRGVSSLRILKKIMEEVAQVEGKKFVKPCEYFDMIAGTSTGGLIALMLGRLRMSIKECEDAYDDISKKVFGTKSGWIVTGEKSAFAFGSNVYEGRLLEEAVKEIVKRRLGDFNAPIKEAADPACKVLVMAALASAVENGNRAVHLRSYDIGVTVPSEYTGWSIWEAARATSAAPTYFDRLSKGGKEFVDGGLGWNNPTFELLSELRAVYSKGFTIGCVVSIGTGIPPKLKLGSGLMSTKDFIAIMANSETVHNTANSITTMYPQAYEEKYWRFNMSKAASEQDWVEKVVSEYWGLRKTVEKKAYEDIMVSMDDWEAIGMIRALTNKWLDHNDTKEQIQECAKRIAIVNKL